MALYKCFYYNLLSFILYHGSLILCLRQRTNYVLGILLLLYFKQYGRQSNNYGMRIYVIVYSDFKYIIYLLLRHLFPPFLKKTIVNTNVTISQTLSDSLVDSDTNLVIGHLRQHNNSRHFLRWRLSKPIISVFKKYGI